MNSMIVAGLGCVVSVALTAQAADIQKADNATPLNLPASWTGGKIPGTEDKAVFGAFGEDREVAFGADAAWRGIVITNTWTLTGPAALTLGADGISSDGNLTLADAVDVTLGAPQTWRIGGQERRVRIAAPIQGAAAATLTKTGFGSLILPVGNPFEGAFQLGHVNDNSGAANTSTNPLSAAANSGGFVIIGSGDSLGRGTLRFRGTQIIADVPGLTIPNDGILDSGAFRVGGTNDLTFTGAFTLNGSRDLGAYTTAGNTHTFTGPVNIGGNILSLRGNASLANAMVFTGPLTGTGEFLLNPDFAASTAYLTTDNTATFSGTVNIQGGTLALTHPDAAGARPVNITAGNTQLALADGIVFTNTVTVSASGSNNKTLATLAGATAEFAGPVIINEPVAERARFYSDPGETLTVSGPVTTAAGGVAKAGPGILILPTSQPGITAFCAGNGGSNISPTPEASDSSGGTVIIGDPESLGRGLLTAKGAQIRAAVPGLTVTNAILLGTGSLRFGGRHDLTLSGAVTMADHREIGNYSRDRALTFTGPVTIPAGRRIALSGIPDAPANGTIAFTGPVSGGYLIINDNRVNSLNILAGANTFPGETQANGGTLRLDYSTEDNSKLSDTAALLLNGTVAVELLGGTHLERVGGTTVSRPAVIRRLSGSAVLALGDITFPASSTVVGGTLHLEQPGIASTTTPNVNGILPNVTVALTDGTTVPATVSNISDGSGGFLIIPADNPFSPASDIPHLGGILPHDPTLNARIVDGGSGTEVTAAQLTNTVSTLTVTAAESPTLLALAPDALLTADTVTLAPGAADFAIGAGAIAPSSSTLALINNAPAATLRLAAATCNTPGGGRVTLVKRGPGTVLLTGANSHSGGLAVEQGTLQIGDGGTTGSWGTSLGYVYNNATIHFNLSAPADQTLSPNILGTGRLVKSGSGIIRLRGNDSVFAGGVEINGGSCMGEDTGIIDERFLNLGSGPITVNDGGRVVLRADGPADNAIFTTGDGYTPVPVTVSGAATIEVNRYDTARNRSGGTFLFDSLTLADSSLTLVASYAYSAAFTGPVDLLAPATITVSASNPGALLRFDGPISDGGLGHGFTKTGTGTLALNAPGAFSGNVTLGGGNSVTNGPDAFPLTIAGGILLLGDSHALGTGTVTSRGAQPRAARPGIVIPNDIFVEGGGFRVGGTNDIAFTGLITLVGATRGIGVYSTGITLTVGPVNLNGNALSFEGFGTGGTNGTILVLGPIAGANTVTLSGALFAGGTVIFAATNTYTGTTTIGADTTLILGHGAAAGSISLTSAIANYGTLAFNLPHAATQGVHFANSFGAYGGAVSQRGPGPLVITSGITSSGAVHAAAGALLEFAGPALPHRASPLIADGAIAFARTADTVFSNTLTGAGLVILENHAQPPHALSFAGDLTAFTGTVHVRPDAILAAGESPLPALILEPAAVLRWNVSESANDTFTVTGDLTLPPEGIALDIIRPEGIRPNLRGRVLLTYGGAYIGSDQFPVGPAHMAVHDPGTKTVSIIPLSEGTIMLLK